MTKKKGKLLEEEGWRGHGLVFGFEGTITLRKSRIYALFLLPKQVETAEKNIVKKNRKNFFR